MTAKTGIADCDNSCFFYSLYNYLQFQKIIKAK